MAAVIRWLLCKAGWHFHVQFCDQTFCLYCGRKPSEGMRIL